jgi:alkyl sulfatase BDS1-like metallo-beta-lactamase superfamily hydrolase
MRVIQFAVFLLLTLSACAAEDKYVNELYDLQKIADGVYSFIAPESDSGVVQSNCTVVIGEDAVLVVDTGQFPSLAERMVADIRKLTGKPVRYIVISDNVAPVKHFLGVLTRALRRARHFALVEGSAIPTKARS